MLVPKEGCGYLSELELREWKRSVFECIGRFGRVGIISSIHGSGRSFPQQFRAFLDLQTVFRFKPTPDDLALQSLDRIHHIRLIEW